MLNITREGNIIKVIETTYSFTDAQTTTILYDLNNYRSKVNNDPWRDMSQSSIDWVLKYYLPKAKPTISTTEINQS